MDRGLLALLITGVVAIVVFSIIIILIKSIMGACPVC